MNLRMPQAQIGSGAVLGILGTMMDCRVRPMVTRVQFILSFVHITLISCRERIESKLGVEVTETSPIPVNSPPFSDILLFTVTVEGELRNPWGLLKAIARKIRPICLEAQTGSCVVEETATDQELENRDTWTGNLFSTDNWQSDQMQIKAESGD